MKLILLIVTLLLISVLGNNIPDTNYKNIEEAQEDLSSDIQKIAEFEQKIEELSKYIQENEKDIGMGGSGSIDPLIEQLEQYSEQMNQIRDKWDLLSQNPEIQKMMLNFDFEKEEL